MATGIIETRCQGIVGKALAVPTGFTLGVHAASERRAPDAALVRTARCHGIVGKALAVPAGFVLGVHAASERRAPDATGNH